MKTLRPKARVAYPNGVEPAPKKSAGFKIITFDGVGGRRAFEHLNKALAKVEFKVPIGASFPLSQTAKAQEIAQKSHVLGKVVLRVAAYGDTALSQ